MNTFSNELKAVISRHLEAANTCEVIEIASALCRADVLDRMDLIRPSRQAADIKRGVSDETPRFEILDVDQILDRDTGLIWTRDHLTGESMPWKDAAKACEQLDLRGHTDWRMPTIQELLTLVDYERHDPCIDTEVFHCKSNWYWSGTPYAPSPGDCAWGVFFNYGSAVWSYRGYGGFVRAVRAGQ